MTKHLLWLAGLVITKKKHLSASGHALRRSSMTVRHSWTKQIVLGWLVAFCGGAGTSGQTPDWGRVQAGKDQAGHWEAILENSRLRVRYGYFAPNTNGDSRIRHQDGQHQPGGKSD